MLMLYDGVPIYGSKRLKGWAVSTSTVYIQKQKTKKKKAKCDSLEIEAVH